MPESNSSTRDRALRYLPLLLLLFVGSGCSALIYEIVWLHLLQLVIGSSAVSLGVLLGTFMGGMCLGSIAFPRLISARHHPLKVYATLELGIGLIGLLLLILIPQISRFYLLFVGHGTSNVLLRGVVCGVCLLPPTILMGATLPAIARWMETTRQDISRLGFFYGANIAGAVLGCLWAGFYLLRVHDVATATYVAVTINGVVALVSLAAASRVGERLSAEFDTSEAPPQARIGAWTAYVATAISGFCALGAEVVWTRLLSLMLGASVYTFSIILSVFLVGLGLGSSAGSVLARTMRSPRMALGVCQVLVMGAVAWTAFQLSRSLPYWPIDLTLPTSPWLSFQLDILRCLWAFLPASFFWGASFPLALAAVAQPGRDPGKLVGGVYAANTVGAILGALGFSLLVTEAIGTQQAQQLLVTCSTFAALLMFLPDAAIGRTGEQSNREEPESAIPSPIVPRGLVFGTAVASMLVFAVPPTPAGLIGYGRSLPTWPNLPEFLYIGEGMNASIAVSQREDKTREFHVSGKVVASSQAQDMRVQRMLGHIPALIHPEPRSVLVVGCGAGVTAGCFLVHPNVQRVVVCEIEPLIPPAATKYFGPQNNSLMNDPRVEIVHDDARHFIATTSERFDVITSDPIHPWVKGAAALYSKEYFELCKGRLNPHGVVTQWVPLYETSHAAVRVELATFFQVFPEGTIWSNDIDGDGYDVVVTGQVEPAKLDADALHARLQRADHRKVAESLAEVRFESALDLLVTFAGRAAELGPWLEGAEINHDRSLRLQYLAGLSLNRYEATSILESILAHRTFSEDLFPVTGVQGETLKLLLEHDRRR